MTDPTPVRLVRSRKKGAKLVSPNGLPIVCVTRPGKWGNPFKVGGHYKMGAKDFGAHWVYLESYASQEGFHTIQNKAEAVEWFERYAVAWKADQIRAELRGKNLACYCKEGPCHADVLLRIANERSDQ